MAELGQLILIFFALYGCISLANDLERSAEQFRNRRKAKDRP